MAKEISIIVRLVDRIKTDLAGVRSSFARLGGMISKLGIVTGVAFAFVKALRSMTNAVRDHDRAEQDLARAFGRSKEDMSEQIDRFNSLADAIANVTVISDEQVTRMFALAKNLGVTDDAMEQTIVSAIGLSRKLGIELPAAVKLLADAQNGNVKGFERFNIVMSETQSAQENYNKVLRIGLDNFANVTREVHTSSGAWVQFKNSVNDLIAAFSDLAENSFIARALQRITSWVDTLTSKIVTLRRLIGDNPAVGGRVDPRFQVTPSLPQRIKDVVDKPTPEVTDTARLRHTPRILGGQTLSLREAFDRARGQSGDRILETLQQIRALEEQQVQALNQISNDGLI